MKLNKESQTRLLLLAALFVSCLFIFRSYLFGDSVLVFDDVGGDTWQQYTMHYASIVNHLRAGNFSLWDFTNGMGTNMFSLSLFDPSLILLYLIGVVLGPAHMLFYLVWLQVLKVLAADWVFYLFLSEFTYSRQAKFLAAFAYGMNGYLMVWGQHYQFGMVTIYLPLILLFEEKFLRGEKGKGFFPVAVFLSGIYSVYFSYMSLIAAGFYLLFRIAMEEKLSWKQRMGKFFGGCGQMLLGIGMSLAAFLPTAATLMNSSRITSGENGIGALLKACFSRYSIAYYKCLLIRPFSTNLENLQTLGDGKYEGLVNYYEDPVLFCSTLAVLAAVQFVFVLWRSQEKKRVKISLYAACALTVLLVLLPLGGTAFNAFTDPTNRYTYILMVLLLLVTAWMWDYLRAGGRISILALAVTAVLMMRAYMTGYEQSIFKEYRINALILAVTGCVMLLCILCLGFVKNQSPRSLKVRKVATGFLAAALLVNVISEGGITYVDRVVLKKTDTPADQIPEQMEVYAAAAQAEDSEEKSRAVFYKPQTYFTELYRQDLQDALNYLKETDPEFYRVEKDYSSATYTMDSLAQGYRGISTYNSVLNGNLKEFVDVCYPELYYMDQNRYAFWPNAEDNFLAAFTGVRYLLSKSGDLDSSKYELMQQFGGIYLYRNVQEAATARFYVNTISEDSLKELCNEENRETLLENSLALEDGREIEDLSDLEEISDAQKKSSVVLNAPEKDSCITGTVSARADGYVLCMIPYENGWTVSVDGEEVETEKGDLGFLAFPVKEGEHQLIITFHAPGLKAGAGASIVCWIIYFGMIGYGRRRKRKAAVS